MSFSNVFDTPLNDYSKIYADNDNKVLLSAFIKAFAKVVEVYTTDFIIDKHNGNIRRIYENWHSFETILDYNDAQITNLVYDDMFKMNGDGSISIKMIRPFKSFSFNYINSQNKDDYIKAYNTLKSYKVDTFEGMALCYNELCQTSLSSKYFSKFINLPCMPMHIYGNLNLSNLYEMDFNDFNIDASNIESIFCYGNDVFDDYTNQDNALKFLNALNDNGFKGIIYIGSDNYEKFKSLESAYSFTIQDNTK